MKNGRNYLRLKRVLALTVVLSMSIVQNAGALELTSYTQDEELVIGACEEEALVGSYVDEQTEYADDLMTEDSDQYESITEDEGQQYDTELDVTAEASGSISEMFPGVKGTFELSSEEIADKAELREHIPDNSGLYEGIDYVEGEILVSADTREEAEEYAQAFNGKLESYEYDMAAISLNADKEFPKATVMDAVTASAMENIALPAAWPNFYRYLYEDEIISAETAVNDDPLLDPANTYNMYQWHHSFIDSYLAWEAGYAGQGVKVCVIDTGINSSHEEFAGRITKKTGCAANNYEYEDVDGHGTNVAGLIGGAGDNGKGGKGVAYKCDLYIIGINAKDSSTGKYGLSDDGLIEAIGQATADNVDVINMSLGGGGYSDPLNKAVKKAYDSGIAVMCAAGNEDTNAIAYPAGCDGAISIAAVNRENKKTVFSNYGGIDFSGPGVDMFSPYIGSSSKYGGMNGTSQATPCVSGIAAVLLSTGKVEGTGSTRVENLKKLMASGCMPSGLGKGTPNLAKILKLANSVTAPSKPTIRNTVSGDKIPGTYTEEAVSVYFNDIVGSSIYYTTDGSNITYKDGKVSDNAQLYKGSAILLTGASKIVLKAIAVNTGNWLASPVASYTYVLKPKVRSVQTEGTGGVNTVIKGRNLQMTAVVEPDYAADKRIAWSLDGSPAGISITSSGVLKVAKDASASSCTVIAKAMDGSNVQGTAVINIAADTSDPVKSIKAVKKSFTLYTGRSEETDITVTMKNGSAVEAATALAVASKDADVASGILTGNKLTVNAGVEGKTKILLTARDGSGVSVTINVTVKQSVTDFAIEGLKGNKLAKGKGFKPSVTFDPETAALKKLNWSLTTVPAGTTADQCGVKVNASSGAVSAGKNAASGLYTITGKTKDGSNIERTYSFEVMDDRITGISINSKGERIFRVQNKFGSPTTATVSFTVNGLTTNNSGSISVTSSNENIAGVILDPTSSSFTVAATGRATGTVKITVASADGTNIKKTISVKVANPPSAVRLAVSDKRADALARNKTLKIKAIVEEGYGKVDSASKKFTFISDHPEWITVNNSGVAKAVSSYSEIDSSSGRFKPAVITAEAADGSKVTAKYNVTPCIQIKKITACYVSSSGDYGHISSSGSVYKGNRGWLSKGSSGALIGLLTATESSNLSGRFRITVNKPGLGVKPIVDATYGYYGVGIVGNEKGKYTVSIKPTDGNGASCSWSVEVR
ncbi:MAG: S8 family serine peptidase [Lachnospiraceae bacterium]|nr:S8 family serine peptidase [Lachnospiraceae bacterium]